MISNLNEYFASKYEFYLDEVTYRRKSAPDSASNLTLNCHDNYRAEVKGSSVVLTITRHLSFDQEALFELIVSFGAILTFNAEKAAEYDWNKIDLAEEFKNNGDFVTANLTNRITFLVGAITSSYGQAPIILPPIIK